MTTSPPPAHRDAAFRETHRATILEHGVTLATLEDIAEDVWTDDEPRERLIEEVAAVASVTQLAHIATELERIGVYLAGLVQK